MRKNNKKKAIALAGAGAAALAIGAGLFAASPLTVTPGASTAFGTAYEVEGCDDNVDLNEGIATYNSTNTEFELSEVTLSSVDCPVGSEVTVDAVDFAGVLTEFGTGTVDANGDAVITASTPLVVGVDGADAGDEIGAADQDAAGDQLNKWVITIK